MDELGRDVYTRIVHGSRITLLIVLLVAIIAAPVGLAVGTVAGYFGGWIDTILMRTTDVFLSFPGLVLALAFVVYTQEPVWFLMIGLLLLTGPDHPPTRDDTVQLGLLRTLIGYLSLAIPIVCFAPRAIFPPL